MGQQLFKVHLNIDDNIAVNSDPNLSNVGPDDISFFFPLKSFDPTEFENHHQISTLQTEFTKQIRTYLSTSTKSIQWENINTEINEILMNNVFISIGETNKKVIEENENHLIYQQQFQTSLKKKLHDDSFTNVSLFAQPFPNISSEIKNENDQQKSKYQSEQLLYLVTQSLISTLLILIKSAEKQDPIIIHQILTLASQLCEQFPMKSLSSTNSFLVKSLQPLVNYIIELSSTTDPFISKQATKILLSFSIAKGSFKDILPILNKLIFNTTDVYDVQVLFRQLNNGLTETIENWEKQQLINTEITELISLDYLKTIGSYPSIQLNEKLLTGVFISSIILSHIDIENIINSPVKQSKLSSISSEFHPDTFKYLFNIIEQLTTTSSPHIHMLTICLRLFTTHLQFLSDTKFNQEINLTTYTTHDELQKWFDLLLKLSCHESSEHIIVSTAASKALIYVINIHTPSFIEKLSIFHQYILENQHPILIQQFFIELNKSEILLNWMEVLCNENKTFPTLEILYSFIDLYFNITNEQKSGIQQILFSFQQLFFSQLINQCEKRILTDNVLLTSSLITQYLTYIFKKYLDKISIENDLFNSILIALCLMTKTNEIFIYEVIQPIFISILPLLSEYYLQNPNQEFLCFLIGRITHVLIIGSPQDSLEIKHTNKLKSSIFANGCLTNKSDYLLNSNLAIYSHFQLANDTEDDNNFLMSIYNNVDQGAQLISKLKLFIKDKQPLLQKSIEQQANDACASVFAAYVKHYRRINLAKSELSRTDQTKPSAQLLSLYQHANCIQTLFATTKGQGGDCNDLYQQIKAKTLFLLLFIKENDFIPIIIPDIQLKKEFTLQRQHSHWSKAKHVIKLLRHLFQACIRFKKFMLESKQIKYDYESVLHRTIEDFYRTSISMTSEEEQIEIDELEKCLCRQHERAMIRLITYRFIERFISNVSNTDLVIYLPYLKKIDLEWSYFEGIQASNNQLKEGISSTYCSIIKSLQSQLLGKTIFYLLNLSYESIDLCHHQFIEILFRKFVSFATNSEHDISLDLKLSAFNWFRLFVLKLCENIEIEKQRGTFNQILQQQQDLVFNKLILNELKEMNVTLVNDSNEQKQTSLKNMTLGWFVHANETNKSQIQLCINQYLVLLLRCVYFYKHVLSICATVDYLEELLYIYRHSQSNTTRLLTVKLLRYLIPYTDGTAKSLIEKFLMEVLISIGGNIVSQDIVAELISMYRTIISIHSSWQIMATEFVFNSIKSYLNLNSIETNDTHQMNKFLASLCILGGYIEPYRIGSIVKVELNKEAINDEPSLALIIEIDSKGENIETSYTLQHLQTNKIESVTIDKLQLEIDVPPPNHFSLSIPTDSILDTLGHFIQIDTSTSESLILLELQRRCVSVLHHLLNDKTIVEIFMQKSYAFAIAKLCISDSFEKMSPQSTDRQYLEQYCLSLDTQIIETKNKDIVDKNDSSQTISNDNEMNHDQLIIDALSVPSSKYSGWKPYASIAEIEFFKQGRLGNDENFLVSLPRHIADAEAIKECGIKHRFRGRIAPTYSNWRSAFPTFVLENLQLNQGKWYYCVRLPLAGLVQIGWATNGMSPIDNLGVGDDEYSWSYDGSRGVLFHSKGYYSQFDDIRWKANDICGCGIEIDGKNTNIKYWLNGKFLGTAFAHDSDIPQSPSIKCNLLPNGSTTTFFPSISLQLYSGKPSGCEVIISPEDMQDCPLPNGYKPLLLPTFVNTDNSIVDYPFSAYLVGDDLQDLFLTKRTKPATILLRDFINEHHLEMAFIVDDHPLILPNKNNGFLLPIDNDEGSSLTISFEFEILSTDENPNILLFKIDSIKIPWTKSAEQTRCVIIFLSKKRQIKVYINNECQTFTDAFPYETFKKLNIHILPGIAAEIQNLAIWKYALSEEQIRRLFTYGIFFVANDYRERKEYRKQVNTISFSKNQLAFENELLVALNEPFTEELWEKKKKQADEDESEYFKSNNDADYSTIELFGNQTYLVLDKSIEEWSEYTLILDLSIPHQPITNEKLTVIALNPQSKISITHEGKLSLEHNDGTINESNSTIILNEYFRLIISVQEESIRIYLNNKLEIDIKVNDDRFQVKFNRIDLFKENDLTKNTTSKDTLRVSFKSITYLNRSVPIDQLQSPTLIAPPFSIIGSSLMAMGYKKTWIESVMEQYNTTDISTIHPILREQKSEFVKTDLENERKRYGAIFSRLNPSMNQEILKDLISSSTFDTNEQIRDITHRIFSHWLLLQPSEQSIDKIEFGEHFDVEWFSKLTHDLGIQHDITKWIREKVSLIEDKGNIYQLLDSQQTTAKNIRKPIHCSHQNISSKQVLKSRIACEHSLSAIYARDTILNMLKVWPSNESTLFPLEKFGDYTFLITLLKLLDTTKIDKNEKIDRIHSLINSILKTEIKQLLKHIDTIDNNVLQSKSPLLYHLQKDMIIQSILFIFKPSLLKEKSNEEMIVDEQQPNLNFILKILDVFMGLMIDKSIMTQQQMDSMILIFFPLPLINLLFNLFLLVPTLQSTISLLHLFTTLLQASKNFKLTDQIQQFFFQLFIELSSNTITQNNQSRKRLQVALTDLIFVLLTKANTQLQEIESKLPEDIRNLLTTINVIIAWNDQTKQTLLPEIFLEKSNDILGENFKLNQEDFKKSNRYFNTIGDQELINLMNTNSVQNDCFSDFLQSLPIESEPNSTFYKIYISLAAIPADSIQIRARFIILLNTFVEESLSVVDLSLPPGQSILTDQIRTIKSYLLNLTKFQLFNESLEQTTTSNSTGFLPVNFDTVKASTDNENSENTMFYQAYQQLHANAHIEFRRSNEQLWHAQYLDMHSTDAGGPYRDSITRICSDICSTRLSLFILCSNARTNSGVNRDCWIPNVFPPNKSIPNKFKKQYRFVGQLMGMAIRKKHYLDLKFPILLWKQLLREQITIEDIRAIDIQSFAIIDEMEKNIDQMKSVDTEKDVDNLFSSIMSELRFDVVSSSGITYELIPGGAEIPITAANFKQYCSCYRQYRLNEFNRQISLIRKGLNSVIPYYYLSLFTANELEEAVCGKGRTDVELMKRNTSYIGNYNQDSPPIERFWTVFGDMFNDDQKKLFLIFVWGRNTLPSRDEDFQDKFIISSFDVYGGEADKTLPRSHTCYFTIDLPAYSTVEIMHERLNYAISSCSSIDGDGMMDDGPTARGLFSDDSSDEQ